MKNKTFFKHICFIIFLSLSALDIYAQCIISQITHRKGTTEIINGVRVTISEEGYTTYNAEHWCEHTQPYAIQDTEFGALTYQFCPPIEEAILSFGAINGNYEEIIKIHRNGSHYRIPEIGAQISCTGVLPVLTSEGNIAGPMSNTELIPYSLRGLVIPGPIYELTVIDSITVDLGASTVLFSLSICSEDKLASEMLPIRPEDVISIESSASLCLNDLPYKLTPETLYDNLFYTDDSPNPTTSVRLDSFGVYLIKTTYAGCNYERSFELKELCEEKIFIPNAFSPDGDGINDYLNVYSTGIENATFTIYNRWGAKIFSTNNLKEGWDGTFNRELLSADIFVYQLQYDNSITNETKNLSGSFLLVK